MRGRSKASSTCALAATFLACCQRAALVEAQARKRPISPGCSPEGSSDCSKGEQEASVNCSDSSMCGDSGHEGLSDEEVAGIAIAAVTVALLLVALACWVCFQKRKERQIRVQKESDSRGASKHQHVELQHSTDSSPPAEEAKTSKGALAAVSPLQAVSLKDTSQHSEPEEPVGATTGPPASDEGQPQAESDGLVSSWLNKLAHTKIMNWLHQEQTPSTLKNSGPSMQSLQAGPTLQRSSVGHSSVARSSFTLNRTSVQCADLNRNNSASCIHDLGEPATGGSGSGLNRATSACAQALPPMYSGPSGSFGQLAAEWIPSYLRHSPSGDSLSSATFALPPLSPARRPTGGPHSAHSRTLSYTHSTGQLSALRFALPEESPRCEQVGTPTDAVEDIEHAATNSDDVCVEIIAPEARRQDADEC